MPSIFKAFATITAWVLFIWGLIGLVMGVIIGPATAGVLFGGGPPPWTFYAASGLAAMLLTLSVVVMKLRQMMG